MSVQDRYTLAYRLYPYERHADQDKSDPMRHPVVVMGGGPIGIATALDLGRQGIPVVVLDDHEGVGMGSRAICFAKGGWEPIRVVGGDLGRLGAHSFGEGPARAKHGIFRFSGPLKNPRGALVFSAPRDGGVSALSV